MKDGSLMAVIVDDAPASLNAWSGRLTIAGRSALSRGSTT